MFISTNKLSGYPGNPPASRLPATWVTTSSYIYLRQYAKIAFFLQLDLFSILVSHKFNKLRTTEMASESESVWE